MSFMGRFALRVQETIEGSWKCVTGQMQPKGCSLPTPCTVSITCSSISCSCCWYRCLSTPIPSMLIATSWPPWLSNGTVPFLASSISNTEPTTTPNTSKVTSLYFGHWIVQCGSPRGNKQAKRLSTCVSTDLPSTYADEKHTGIILLAQFSCRQNFNFGYFVVSEWSCGKKQFYYPPTHTTN